MEINWISVKEDLPNKGERVLVSDGHTVCLHFKQSCFYWKGEEGNDLYPISELKDEKGVWCNCCDIEEGKITHWARIPKFKEAV